MMQVRCQRCGWMFTLSREGIALALSEAQAKSEEYHALNCPQCRHVIKMQIRDMRRGLPPDYPIPEWKPAEPEAAKEEPPAPPKKEPASKPKAKKPEAKKPVTKKPTAKKPAKKTAKTTAKPKK